MASLAATPATGEWIEHTPYTVNQVYLGCDAMLEGRPGRPFATECHLTFMEGGFFSGWRAEHGKGLCFDTTDESALAYAYVRHVRAFLTSIDGTSQIQVGARPWTTLARPAFEARFRC